MALAVVSGCADGTTIHVEQSGWGMEFDRSLSTSVSVGLDFTDETVAALLDGDEVSLVDVEAVRKTRAVIGGFIVVAGGELTGGRVGSANEWPPQLYSDLAELSVDLDTSAELADGAPGPQVVVEIGFVGLVCGLVDGFDTIWSVDGNETVVRFEATVIGCEPGSRECVDEIYGDLSWSDGQDGFLANPTLADSCQPN